MFDVVFAAAGTAAVRPETRQDAAFVDDLASAGSSLSGTLPDGLIRQQAAFQRLGHEAAYPEAMRRILLCDDRPAGRLVVDWAPDASRCVDIAILPEWRGHGIGTAMLEAWLAVADRLALPATLSVRRDNPAVRLYRRLNFVAWDDRGDPLLAMSRPR